MKPVVIFGTGDFARIAARYLDVDSPHEVVAFTVNRAYVDASELRGLPVVPFEDSARLIPERLRDVRRDRIRRVNQARAGDVRRVQGRPATS